MFEVVVVKFSCQLSLPLVPRRGFVIGKVPDLRSVRVPGEVLFGFESEFPSFLLLDNRHDFLYVGLEFSANIRSPFSSLTCFLVP